MLYRVIGLMSGSSLDGLDIVFAEIHENGGKWSFEILAADCYAYTDEWIGRLKGATSATAMDYQVLHVDFGRYMGTEVRRFIERHGLHFKVALIASHGHTTFHLPARRMTAQLGDGAALAAMTGLPVVTDLRAMDIALGGQGAPIVPIGEKLFFPDYQLFLNIGGIANISFNLSGKYIAYDICPANRVLNLLANTINKDYDDGGQLASSGVVHEKLLGQLNELAYYWQSYPKSLPNSFGTDEIFPLVQSFGLSHKDALRTYVAHIAEQVAKAVENAPGEVAGSRMLVTGGGAFNTFLISCLEDRLKPYGISLVVPDEKIVKYKEALIMGLMGVLRWREENNVLSSVTGAEKDSIGGAVWNGMDS